MRFGASGLRPRRCGAITLELILTLPIVVVLMVATVEYGMLMLLVSTVTHSATVGAREAGKCSDVEMVAGAVQSIVAVNCIEIVDAPGSDTLVVLEDGVAGTSYFGDTTMTYDLPANPLNPDEVRVTVIIALSNTPFCDALGSFGFSLPGCQLQASSLVKKELWP